MEASSGSGILIPIGRTGSIERDRSLALWLVGIAGMAAGSTSFGAGIAFVKSLGA
ncbi:hypothetical protein U8607_03115 [Methylobacterium durans]|uniref:hypothetical protein n=1 Tax=Methylobacterium durans TaxID=2202825 RepID=UPI002AFE1524|nr:hypothetical protein [Methylobacterium durans]MEA1831062.1 hypothetical protein [Methylobacterium durans]